MYVSGVCKKVEESCIFNFLNLAALIKWAFLSRGKDSRGMGSKRENAGSEKGVGEAVAAQFCLLLQFLEG